MKATDFQKLMRDRRKARSPRDKQPYVGVRWLRANCIREEAHGRFVMCDETWILP